MQHFYTIGSKYANTPAQLLPALCSALWLVFHCLGLGTYFDILHHKFRKLLLYSSKTMWTPLSRNVRIIYFGLCSKVELHPCALLKETSLDDHSSVVWNHWQYLVKASCVCKAVGHCLIEYFVSFVWRTLIELQETPAQQPATYRSLNKILQHTVALEEGGTMYIVN